MTERRGPGRPPNPDSAPPVKPRPVKLDRDVEDKLCVLALRHGMSVHALLKLAAKRLVEDPTGISGIQKTPA